MSEKKEILCYKNNAIKTSTVELWENDDNVRICFQLDDITIDKSGDNFFETLVAVRKELEAEGVKLLCKGCSKNVYPSGMLLNMGAGRKAYTLTLGMQAKRASLVDIFESSSLDEYASIGEQCSFFDAWTRSL